MVKIWAIVRKEVYLTYTNRNLVLLMILIPLVLAVVIGMALGGLTRGSADIRLAVVNLDQTTSDGLNYGQVVVSALVPGAANPLAENASTCNSRSSPSDRNPLFNLVHVTQMADADSARQAVNRGEYAAALIIPTDFSAKIGVSPTHLTIEPVQIEVYADSGQPAPAQIIRNIAEGMTHQIVSGNIAVVAALTGLQQRFGLHLVQAISDSQFRASFACGFFPSFSTLSVEQQTTAGLPASLDLFTYFACGQAMLWMLGAAFLGATDILNEERQGTLARLLTTAATPMTVLVAKLIGTFINCTLQLVLLFLAFTVVGSVIHGEFKFIWGTDFPSLGLLMVTAALSAAGFGTLLMSVVRTPEQAAALNGLVTTFMAALGGAFFPVKNVPVLQQIASISPLYWGADAFYRLAYGQGGIALHLVILLMLGGVSFGIGLWLFRRRLAI